MRRIKLFGKGNLTPALRILAWLMRLVVGGTFIFSGFTKAVDPYGTYYKLVDYAGVFGWQIPEGVLLIGAFVLFAAEFVIGVMLFCGCFRRTSSACATLVMAFMLPLSLWLALDNPVADCGCFGDALVISNWSTFWKNVGLTAACVWLLFFNRRIHWLVTPALQWLALTLAIAYPVYLGAIGLLVQPAVDFRPYKVGMELVDTEESGDDEENVLLIYRDATGKEKNFNLDSLPDENAGWTFVRQQEIPVGNEKDSKETSGHDLRIFSADGEDDVTAEVLNGDGEQLILFMPGMTSVNLRDTWPINSLYRYCLDHNVDMMAVCAGTPEEISVWEDVSLAEYPVYTAEDTFIKEVVRGNPALVYLKDGKIVWKQTLGSVDIDALTATSSPLKLKDMSTDTGKMLVRATWIFIILMAVLAFFSFLPPAYRLSKRISRRRRIAKALKKEAKKQA